jgi:hypothetical protein
LKLNGTLQLLVYADYVNILGGSDIFRIPNLRPLLYALTAEVAKQSMAAAFCLFQKLFAAPVRSVARLTSFFVSTYLCEEAFSQTKTIKSG